MVKRPTATPRVRGGWPQVLLLARTTAAHLPL